MRRELEGWDAAEQVEPQRDRDSGPIGRGDGYQPGTDGSKAQKQKRGAEGNRFGAIYGLCTMDFRMECLKNCLDVSTWDEENTYRSIQ